MSDRRRNAFILLLVAGLLVGSGVAIALKKTRLGLDLKGGVELVYQGKPTKQSQVNADSLNRAIDIMRKRVDQLGVAEPAIQRIGSDQIDVALPDVKNAQKAIAEVGRTAQLYFYDWEANVIGPDGKTVTPDPNTPPAPTDTATGDSAADGPGGATSGMPEYQAVLLAAKRPTSNPRTATTNGTWYLVNDKQQAVVAGPEEQESALFTEGKPIPPGSRAVHVNSGTVLVQALPVTSGTSTTPGRYIDRWYVLNDNPAISGNDINNPQQQVDNGPGGTGQPIVTFGFNGSGGSRFQGVTATIAARGRAGELPGTSKQAAFQHFAIALDNQLVTVPFIDFTQNPGGIDPTNGSEITGGFTLDTAQQLADELKSGALPIKLQLISDSQVSATLGKTALNQGLLAGLIGFGVVCLFLLAFYRLLGLIAVLALLVYAGYFFALIKLVPITLTLPGIAGLILTIGVAADANIVIFERIKEEIRSGKSIARGIADGYRRGFAAIVDANVVTFMTAFILFALATAGVKGFAFTLGIGTLVSLFTAVLATQAALGAIGRSRMLESPAALGAGHSRRRWTFDFMGKSRWFFTLSGTILLVGALAIGGRGINFGIDFKSGTRIETAFATPANESQIRSVLAADGYPNAQIQRLSSKEVGGNGFQISLHQIDPQKVSKIETDLNKRFETPGAIAPNGTRNFSVQSIGPTFGRTVANSAVIAIIASLLVISAYIALRFEWKFAVPVLIALMHDLLITAGVYSLTGREVTAGTVAALLTILGYSLYDTIIVFDRVRENVPRMPRAAFSQIVNRSMSEVLTRSLATSFSTLLPVVALLLFGGTTLKDFAFALLIGVASGAYSSIFIASPVLTHWKERERVYRTRRARIIRELGAVPAYAAAGEVAPAPEPAGDGPRRGRRRPTPVRRGFRAEDPGEQLSRGEFEQLVRELEPDLAELPPDEREPVAGGGRRGRRGRDGGTNGEARGGGAASGETAAARAEAAAAARLSEAARAEAARSDAAARAEAAAARRAAAAEREEALAREAAERASAERERDPTADLEPEDVVMPAQRKPPTRGGKSGRSRRGRRHGRTR